MGIVESMLQVARFVVDHLVKPTLKLLVFGLQNSFLHIDSLYELQGVF